ncbi:FIST signal transduction protein [Porticoccus sp.]
MHVEQYRVESADLPSGLKSRSDKPDLVLIFASPDIISRPGFFESVTATYPHSALAGCSTAGEIYHTHVCDHGLVICEISFVSSRCAVVSEAINRPTECYQAGVRLARKMELPGLKGVIVFGPGVDVNGSAIVDGMGSILGAIPVSGGLAGDGGLWRQTYTLTAEGIASAAICAIGLYGEALSIEYGSFGGWEPFGPLRKITRHEANILYELDNRPALDLYQQYLGEYAEQLPVSGLYFPMEMVRLPNKQAGIIRTIADVDEDSGSLILAGDMEPDSYMRLMHTSTDGLINGAEAAASQIGYSEKNRLALVVSCFGRKVLMGDEVEEEIEVVRMRLGLSTTTTGFYSYGEICPAPDSPRCRFHNQTMTLTVITEGLS